LQVASDGKSWLASESGASSQPPTFY